eukprot:3787702-Prymnesium_polylepis.1
MQSSLQSAEGSRPTFTALPLCSSIIHKKENSAQIDVYGPGLGRDREDGELTVDTRTSDRTDHTGPSLAAGGCGPADCGPSPPHLIERSRITNDAACKIGQGRRCTLLTQLCLPPAVRRPLLKSHQLKPTCSRKSRYQPDETARPAPLAQGAAARPCRAARVQSRRTRSPQPQGRAHGRCRVRAARPSATAEAARQGATAPGLPRCPLHHHRLGLPCLPRLLRRRARWSQAP